MIFVYISSTEVNTVSELQHKKTDWRLIYVQKILQSTQWFALYLPTPATLCILNASQNAGIQATYTRIRDLSHGRNTIIIVSMVSIFACNNNRRASSIKGYKCNKPAYRANETLLVAFITYTHTLHSQFDISDFICNI